MPVNKFCCCCNLRVGCIAMAWLQLIVTTVITATATVTYSDMKIFLIVIGIIVVKTGTCIAITWGILNKRNLFYLPWLFISGFEASVSSVVVLIFFIFAFLINQLFVILFIICAVITALKWYFWVCMYTVYQRDIKQLSISPKYELQNQGLTIIQ